MYMFIYVCITESLCCVLPKLTQYCKSAILQIKLLNCYESGLLLTSIPTGLSEITSQPVALSELL